MFSGKFSVLRSFDYEVESGFDIKVQAINNNKKTALASVKVKVTNVDDKPTFKQSKYEFAINEDSTTGSTLLTAGKTGMELQDLDSRPDQYECTFTDVPSSYVLDHFELKRVNSEWYLVTKKPLSYSKDTKFSFSVTATNKDVPSVQTSCPVVVNINDVNDNIPVFNQNDYWVTISVETSIDTSILQVQATDNDRDNNGQVSYQLLDTNSDLFFIDPISGVISTKKTLPVNKQEFSFAVKASDKGMHTDTSI